jgi:hypothetical protein
MSFGKARNDLNKSILFMLVTETNKNICFQCGNQIETVGEFSVEHKVPWLHSEEPAEMFFDLDNIAFSHLSCNAKAARVGAYNKKQNLTAKLPSSGFRGVHKAPSRDKTKPPRFRVRVTVDKKEQTMGIFDCPVEAAKHYDLEIVKIHGDDALTNESLGLLSTQK